MCFLWEIDIGWCRGDVDKQGAASSAVVEATACVVRYVIAHDAIIEYFLTGYQIHSPPFAPKVSPRSYPVVADRDVADARAYLNTIITITSYFVIREQQTRCGQAGDALYPDVRITVNFAVIDADTVYADAPLI